jgi:hypothetical protein
MKYNKSLNYYNYEHPDSNYQPLVQFDIVF